MIIALMFFSISGAVILRVFAAADVKARNSERLSLVISNAQSAAEVYSTCGSADDALKRVFGAEAEDGCVLLNDKCRASNNGSIRLDISESENTTEAGTYSELTMTFSYKESELYTLTCAAYLPAGGDVGG